MRKTFLLTATVVACLSGQAQNRTTDYKESSARNLEPMHSVMVAPLIADLQIVGDRIVHTEKEAFANYVVTPEIVSFIPNFKKVALSCAARAHNADAIIGAVVDVITNANGRLEITISGYPAKYTNFRNATQTDMGLVQEGLKLMRQNDTDILSTPTDQVRKKVEIEK